VIEPLELDRSLRAAANAWQAWRERLELGPTEDSVLERFREVSGRAGFLDVSALHPAEPLREPLRRWVFRLTQERVNAEVAIGIAALRHEVLERSDLPEYVRRSRRELLWLALTDAPRRTAWLQVFSNSAEPLGDAECLFWERSAEINRQLRVDPAAALTSPLRADAAPAKTASGLLLPAPQAAEDAPSANSPSPGALDSAPDAPITPQSLAERCLKRLAPRLKDLRLRQLPNLLDAATSATVPLEVPLRLTGDRLLDLFRERDLFHSLDLPDARFPTNIGLSSFIRSLDTLGQCWQRALEPAQQPFCLSVDPYGLERLTAGALFASLPANVPFMARQLGTSRNRAPEVRRACAQVGVIELAWRAIKVLLGPSAQSGRSRYREHFVHHVGETFGVGVPKHLAGALAPLRANDEQRLLAIALAHDRVTSLTESHDEDWFRNPRAIEQLRAEHAQLPSTRVEPARAARCVETCVDALLAAWD
jgi:hypothetical protein